MQYYHFWTQETIIVSLTITDTRKCMPSKRVALKLVSDNTSCVQNGRFLFFWSNVKHIYILLKLAFILSAVTNPISTEYYLNKLGLSENRKKKIHVCECSVHQRVNSYTFTIIRF